MSRKEKYYDKRDTYIITHKLKLSQKNPNTLLFQNSQNLL